MTSSRPRKTKVQRLAELGISEEEFDQFKQMFCDSRLKYKYIKMRAGVWGTFRYPWDDRLILMHLTHEETIGLFPANQIDNLIFDIDNHDPGSIPSVEERARMIMKVFDCVPLIYRSSHSGGLRICYFLQGNHTRKSMYEFARRSLAEAGLQIESGFIEIMATNKGDRLPFGEGSYLVDPHTFETLHTVCLKGRIAHASGLYCGEKLHIQDSVVGSSSRPQNRNEFNDVVAGLIENGLPSDMTTNDALMRLNWELMGKRGMSASEAERWLCNWIAEKHNGNSIRVNANNIDEIFAQICRLVKSFDPSKIKCKGTHFHKPWKHLTIGDVQRIVGVFPGYRLQLAAFSLLQCVKSSGSLLRTLEYSDSEDTKKENNSYFSVLGFLQVWECEIPYKLFLHLDGFDRTHPAKTRKVLEDYGLLRLHRREDHSKHKCRAYLVYFTFNSESEEVVSMKEALRSLKTTKELKAEYGPYRSTKLIRG